MVRSSIQIFSGAKVDDEIGEVTEFEYLSPEEFEHGWEIKTMDTENWTSLERLEMRFPAMFFQRKT